MLIRKTILERIKGGDVTLAFRRWKRPSVKSGSTLKTVLGLVSISTVSSCTPNEISNDDARKAGYRDRRDLLDELDQREGEIYRIRLAYAGDDPRIALREDANLTDEDVREIKTQLERYDRASRQGDWTRKFLELIASHPMLAAVELAAKAGVEKDWLKINVRKLKNLGLTISHQPGYEISPRGKEYLRRTTERA
ncbi:MAG: hypothetical protein WA771_00970 [Chthoniobacterales bacterium]